MSGPVELLRKLVADYDEVQRDRDEAYAAIIEIAASLGFSQGAVPGRYQRPTFVGAILAVLSEARINAYDMERAAKAREENNG